ncbi:hypothetical protein PA0748 [Candidatus Phytoplasma australiense]|uniref:Uncharacterized protein n=1 Tax=Phytoplasma australiense TaxID=59748 RepID=B1VAV9_PHYAS|nr:hypothetical protein PA0748 [Candidatus Phytoplasma australiense]
MHYRPNHVLTTSHLLATAAAPAIAPPATPPAIVPKGPAALPQAAPVITPALVKKPMLIAVPTFFTASS